MSGIFSLSFYEKLDKDTPRFRWYRVVNLTNSQTLVLLVVMFTLIFVTKDAGMSRLFMGSFILSAWVFFFVLNNFLPLLLSRMVFQGANARVCLLVGTAESCEEIEDWMLSRLSIGLQVVGYLGIKEEEDPGKTKVPYLGSDKELEAVIEGRNVNQVILLETRHSKEWVQHILRLADKHACRVLIYNPWREYFNQPLHTIQEGRFAFFTIKDEPLESPVSRFYKRCLDLMIALPVVLFLLPVLCLIVGVAQRIQSPGPLFFKQRRIGMNRKEFYIYKFRSMVYEKGGSNQEGKQASSGDSRFFKFGKIIRKYSIDEFPQFLNVMLGQMSAVGPRPHYYGHDKLFTQYIYQYRQRHFAKPGITGLAQSKGFRGEITDLELLKERTHYDLEYIDNWSLSLDLSIILRTIFQVVFPPKTAY
jgi:exopolysaccharide biosynthesis polyprenyl glycosylphosphotransferase